MKEITGHKKTETVGSVSSPINGNNGLSWKAKAFIGVGFAGLLLANGVNGAPTPESSRSALSIGDGQNRTLDLSTMIPTRTSSDSKQSPSSLTPTLDRVVSQITGAKYTQSGYAWLA